MFDVIRKKTSGSSGKNCSLPPQKLSFEDNLKHITKFRVRSYPVPHGKETLTPAYGFGKFVKLTKLISSKSEILQNKALETVGKECKVSDSNITEFIRAGIVPKLMELVCGNCKNAQSRRLSCAVLSQIVFRIYGRTEFAKKIEKGGQKLMTVVKNEKDVIVLKFVIRCLRYLGKDYCRNCVELFIDTIKQRKDNMEVLIEAIRGLSCALEEKKSYQICVELGIMKVFKVLLTKEWKKDDGGMKIQLFSIISNCICLLCFDNIGLGTAVKTEFCSVLVKLIQMKSNDLSEFATQALMFITLSIRGKVEFLSTKDGVEQLEILVLKENINRTFKVNCLKVICNCSENPRGRKQFKTIDKELKKQFSTEKDEFVKESLKIAIAKINQFG